MQDVLGIPEMRRPRMDTNTLLLIAVIELGILVVLALVRR